MTPIRVMSTLASSSLNVRPSRSKSKSRRKRRVGSASALNTRSSSTLFKIGNLMVTCQVYDATVAQAMWGVGVDRAESAGINRHGGGDVRALHRGGSDPGGPRG